ncbi:MAG: peroxiredoxin family protein [Longimicrobiales bacterium]
MSRPKATLLISVAAVAISLGATLALRKQGDHAPLDAGHMAPEYVAVTLDGDSLGLSDLRGRAVLLNVWATWCKPCVREMPALERVHQKLGSLGLDVVAVSVDNAAFGVADPAHSVRAFSEEYGLTFTILLDPQSRIESKFRLVGLPMTFLIDREGRVVETIIGARDWDSPEMEAELRTLLES